jgi:hypothetical protein
MYINPSIPAMAWPTFRATDKSFEFTVFDRLNGTPIAHIRLRAAFRSGEWHPSGITLEATSPSSIAMVTGGISDLDKDDSLVTQQFLMEVGRVVGIIQERRRMDGPTITHIKG